MTRTDWRDGEHTRSVELTPLGPGRYRVVVDGVALELEARRLEDGRLELIDEQRRVVAEVTPDGARRFVRLGTLEFVFAVEPTGKRRARADAAGGLEAPMPGVVTRVMVAAGDAVEKGQPLLALEAMKMEHVLRAPRAGKVASIAARAGEMVAGGATLIALEPEAPPAG